MLYYEVIMPIAKLPVINGNQQGKKKNGTLMIGFSYESLKFSGIGGPSGSGGGGQHHGGSHGMYGGGGMHSGGGGMHGGGRGNHGGGSGSEGSVSGSGSESEKIFWLKDIRLAEVKKF
jgi:hypothetical protein